jgi:hypothetical protein
MVRPRIKWGLIDVRVGAVEIIDIISIISMSGGSALVNV